MLEELAGIGPCMFRAPIAFARKKLFSKIENKKKRGSSMVERFI